MSDYIRFTEYCDHEGETWAFWLQRDGNEAALNELVEIISAADDAATVAEGYWETAYQLLGDIEPEAVVDKLVEYGESGYLDGVNKVDGRLDVTGLRGRDWESVFDLLYKGGIRDFFKEAS
ncbi:MULTISPECIES: hypothetical protein [Nocardia]|uniref:hypothetical protein n=1 Tax=Nocardia TaxID=1817 RepID=UPI000D69278E|nr:MULTISPECIES: hypothetical protein [Nocardia]